MWNEYCDWYLEMAKPRWADDGRSRRPAARARWVAWRVLDGILRLLHPFMPFVTEEIWQAIPHDGEFAGHRELAQGAHAPGSTPRRSASVSFLQELVVAVRNLQRRERPAAGQRRSRS